jgi:hypothetical protein
MKLYNNNSIQFNSIYYLRAESTATRPITDTAQRNNNNNNNNSVALVRERPQLVCEIGANFCG